MLQPLRRLFAFLRRDRRDADLAEELSLHLELRRQALIDEGMPADAATRLARTQFGNARVIRERARDEWASPRLVAVLQDLRFGCRMIARAPALSAVVLLTIALGAGINAALFLVAHNILFQTPDLPAAHRVVWVDDGRPLVGVTYPDYVDYRDRTTAFADLAAFAATDVHAQQGPDGRAHRIQAVLASGNYFAVLQGAAALGRTLNHLDDRPPAGAPAVVLGDAYWTRQFNRDPGVLGSTLDINRQPFTVVGVMPPGFKGVRSANGNPYVPEVWLPMWSKKYLRQDDAVLVNRTFWWGMQTIGRLQEGVSVAQARAQLSTVAAALDAEYPGQRSARSPWAVLVTELDPRMLRGQEGAVVGVLGLASLCVLLIACANVAGLLLARASARRREIAVRLSLGATRARIVRLFLIEGWLLSIAGSLVGWGAAVAVLRAAFAGRAQPLAWSFAPDARSLIFVGLLAAVAAIGTALIPALQASKATLLSALTKAEAPRAGRLRSILIATEVAASLVLLLATALLLRGLIRAHAIDPGFPVAQLVSVDVDAGVHGYEGASVDALLRSIRQELEATPGVVSVALVEPRPLSGFRHGTMLRRVDDQGAPGVRVFQAEVSTSFAATAGLALRRGRWLDERVPDEIVVNETLASQLWPGGDPIGARVTSRDFGRRQHTVVGVVRNTSYVSMREGNVAFMFVPGQGKGILLRTAGPASSVARTIPDAVARVDRRLTVDQRRLDESVAAELESARAIILSSSAVGALALLIALAGIAAAAAQAVAQRAQEIGIRMALGAQRLDAVLLIIRRTLKPVVIGLAAGVIVASQASRVLESQLYGLSRLDAVAFIAATALVMAAAAAAAWLPARRAATIDPIQTLRSE